MEKSVLSDEEINKRLKSCGLRPTIQRAAVYRYLLENRTHPSVDEIYTNLSGDYAAFSKTTVYNCVQSLCEKGLVMPVTIGCSEVRYDGNPSPHAHFRCEQCNSITDIDVPNRGFDIQPPSGSVCKRVDIYLTGKCEKCS
ncbi:MAG: transcriptional repressor [Oscillospiraceae bacterium]|jgi:Fur family peroxide stress response transcriptional regulator|nr:transcriptional repressor [Oscillospiraceae bacterium]